MRVDWRSALLIVLGLVVFVGPTVYILNRSHSIFREECKQQCDAIGMNYKVRAVARQPDDLVYPAECICVVRVEKRWWEVWK